MSEYHLMTRDQLIEAIEDMEFRFDEMTGMQINDLWGFTLPPQPWRIVTWLARHAPKVVSHSALIAAMGCNLVDPPSDDTLKVQISKTRSSLNWLGIEISNVRAVGYKMPAEHGAKWMRWLELRERGAEAPDDFPRQPTFQNHKGWGRAA